MTRFRFSLAQLIGLVLAVALMLLLGRLAMDNPGLATGMLVAGIALGVLLFTNLVLYGILWGFGGLFAVPPEEDIDQSETLVITRSN